jgi:predicted nicotinamide N-methyase
MPAPTPARLTAFVREQTRLVPVPDLPDIRLHRADDVMTVLARAGELLGQEDPPLPFWAFPWAGGLGVARYLVDHPETVASRDVVDLAAGSGLCGIVAARLGAASVLAIDIDPLAGAAVALNARANGVRIGFAGRDPLDDEPPACDLILAGDVCYEETMARRMLAWLGRAADRGTQVLIGDPGRAYLPARGLRRLGAYEVRTSRELEPSDVRTSSVLTFDHPARR